MKSKTIILSSNLNGRGILTLYVEDGLLKAKLRLYDIEKLNQYFKLAVYHKQQVYSANLIFKSGVYTTSFVGDFDMDDDFYTALVDTLNNNNIVLSGGSYAGYFFEDNDVFNGLVSSADTSKPKAEDTLTDSCADCSHCKYKEYFYSQTSQNDDEINQNDVKMDEVKPKEENVELQNTESISEPTTPKTLPTIMESLLPQFEYIFKNFSENAELNKLLPNSKFVSMDENGENYSLGAIYENDKIKYICYAVKANYNTPAPEELGKFYQWLPLDTDDPLSDGYYIVYQDAADLKIVEV